jgi:16S rRNA (cytosine1407-C5)-methyltransferase
LIEISSNIFSYISSLYGEAAANIYSEYIKQDPAQYIRVNTIKTNPDNLIPKLEKDYSIRAEKVDLIPNALKIIQQSNSAGKTIEHITGEYYIQGLSSMIPPLILSPKKDDCILDLCAAPGSKTTEIAELMFNQGTLIANEIALNRVKMLVYNVDRMNVMNTGVMSTKGEWLSKIYDSYFDKILVDAPCSGLGIVQKKEEISNWWSLEIAEKLGDLQLRLLIAAIKMVKTGGTVIYSTCTLTPEENEFIIDTALKKYPVELEDIELPVKSHEGFTSFQGRVLSPTLSKTRRILPWEVNSDGFFIAKLKKTGDTISPEQTIPKQRDIKLIHSWGKEIRSYLSVLSDEYGIDENVLKSYRYIIKRNDIFFVDGNWNDYNPGLFERIGTRFGTFDKKGEIILSTEAAQVLQNKINKKIITFENKEQLKKYLEGGVIKEKMPESGQCVIKYKDFILGTAVVTKEGIKSRFPRSKRTQEILIR